MTEIAASLPPSVLVHGLSDVQMALRARRPVTLLSAPGAALYMGCLWWQELLTAADFKGPALLDCGTAPGRAVEALGIGLKGLVLAPCQVWEEIAAIARQNGALLLQAAPPYLDLRQKGAERRLKDWLGG